MTGGFDISSLVAVLLAASLSILIPSLPPPGVLWGVSPTLVVMLFAYAAFGTVATTGIFGKVSPALVEIEAWDGVGKVWGGVGR